MKRRENGFSLVELLIVVAIILFIAAIAIPNLLHAKIAANEASAVGSTRTIVTAEISYSNGFQLGPTLLTNLQTPAGGCPGTGATTAAACLIGSNLAG
jgi:prepilin-type N-terminal cleavage/methylation domain-containing protein